MLTLKSVYPDWRNANIHESSPAPRGLSEKLRIQASGYSASHFYPDKCPGSMFRGARVENIEAMTFEANTFDLFVTQDVMEHLFDPSSAHREIWRTLRPGGMHVHTAPIYKHLVTTTKQAVRSPDGTVQHLVETPEYHGNPVSDQGSLLTVKYGYDIDQMIAKAADFDVEIRRYQDKTHGILGEFTETIVAIKRAAYR